MDNKRSFPRETVRTKAKLLVDDQWYDCLITNISAVGARLYLRKSVPADEAVSIEIAEFGQFEATVVWCEGDETGLHFEHDPEEIPSKQIAQAS